MTPKVTHFREHPGKISPCGIFVKAIDSRYKSTDNPKAVTCKSVNNLMEPAILMDGRRVQAETCLELEEALIGQLIDARPRLFEHSGVWAVTCQCCEGGGEHLWSPSGHSVDPNSGHYSCGPCAGYGFFKVVIPI